MDYSKLKALRPRLNFYFLLTTALILLRLLLNSLVPLMDKTEARYAEIARIMVETNNWVTPQIDYGLPFWAKPPLAIWLSAVSMKLFGITEFAVRLPYLLLGILLVVIIGKYAKRQQLPFFLAGFILLTIPEFLIHSGVVSTDMLLTFCVTLLMLSFWESMSCAKNAVWNYLFFIGIGLGFLAKGPIVIILTFPPLLVWSLFFKQTRTVLKRLPWVSGSLLALLIAAPWYYLAELKSPGFFNYFIIGEHFKRFFDSSWTGDKYGFPKSQPMGMIWLFLLAFALPWIQFVVYKVWKHRTDIRTNKWVAFLLLWLLWTPLFFTISKSLIHPYIMPVMIPVALLVIHWWPELKRKPLLTGISLVVPVLSVIGLALGMVTNNIEQHSNTDKYLIEQHPSLGDSTLFYLGEKSYSSQFYSLGKINNLSKEELQEKLAEPTAFQILISHRNYQRLSDSLKQELILVDANYKKGMYRSKNAASGELISVTRKTSQ